MPNKNKRRGGRSKVKKSSKAGTLIKREAEASHDTKTIEVAPLINKHKTIEDTQREGKVSTIKTNIFHRRPLASRRKVTEKLHYSVIFNPKFPFHRGTVMNNHDLKKLSLTLVRSADLLTDTRTLKLRIRCIEDFNDQKVKLVKFTSLLQPLTATVDYDSDVVILD